MNTPVISIIMPIYNGEKWLELAIESVLVQHHTNWELIVVNDFSTDNSCNLIQKYVKKDSRISLISNTHTKGLSGTRNTGLDHAKGKYVAFLDCDDFLLPSALQDMQNLLDTTQAPVARGYTITLDAFSHHSYTHALSDVEYAQQRLSSDKTPAQGVAHMYRKNFLDEHKLRFDEDIHSGEDTYFLYKLYALMESIPILTKPSYVYYVNHKKINYNVSYMLSLSTSLVRILDFLAKNGTAERAQPYAPYYVTKWLHHTYVMQQQPEEIREKFLQTSFDIFTNHHWDIRPAISLHFGKDAQEFYEICQQRDSAQVMNFLQKTQCLPPPPLYDGYANEFTLAKKLCILLPKKILNFMRNPLTRTCILHKHRLQWKKLCGFYLHK